ncbi:MAG: CHAT domain-containing protein [Bacteroidaceae bacterium]|nr:CHAT domain-containing protein [Bacteroidaceae bacterium]
MQRILLIPVVILTFCGQVFAQPKDIRTALGAAKEYIDNAENDRTIEMIDEFLTDNAVPKDSSYVQLVYYKAVALSRVGEGKKCVDALEECIDIYEQFGKQDKMMHTLYVNYIRSANDKQEKYLDVLHSLMLCDYFYYSDYLLYLEAVREKALWMSSEESRKFIESEEKIYSTVNKVGFNEFFLYVKGYLMSYDYGRMLAEDEYLEQGKRFLYSAYQSFSVMKKAEDSYALSKIYFNTLGALAFICEAENKFLSAVFYRKKQLAVSKAHWKEWEDYEFTNPWYGYEFKGISGENTLGLLQDYIDDLNEVGNYKEIISVLQAVADSEEWDILEEYEKDYVNSALSDALSSNSCRTKKYNRGLDYADMEWNLENEYGRFFFELENMVKNGAADNEIQDYYIKFLKPSDQYLRIYMCENVFERYGKSNLIEQVIKDNCHYVGGNSDNERLFSYLEMKNGDISSLEEFIDLYRSIWHFDFGLMGGDKSWELFQSLSKSFLKENRIENAIRAQELSVEILRTDKTNPEWGTYGDDFIWSGVPVRDRFFNSGFLSRYVLEQTFGNEISGYLLLSDLYRDAGNFPKQCECLDKAMDVTDILVSTGLTIGTDNHSDVIWRDYAYVYEYVMSQLPIAVDKYPQYADVALRASYMLQGFMFNYKNIIRDAAIRSNDSKMLEYYKLSSKYRGQIEKDLTDIGEIEGEKVLLYEDNLHKLNQIRPIRKILEESILDIDFIKNNLKEDEIFVDFYTLYDDNFVYTYDALVNGQMRYFACIKSTVFAIIYRKSWDCPKVIEIGPAQGREMLSNDWHLDQYTTTDSKDRISELHNDLKFGRYCWSGILEAADVRKGESILFVPTSFLNRFAVEYLPIGNSEKMTDLYVMKRLSSAIELKNRMSGSNNGRIAAFGDLNYSGAPDYNKRIRSRKKDPQIKIRRTRSCIELSDRSELYMLPGGHEELTSIKNNFKDRCSIYSDMRGTKRAINNMDWSSPTYLHISTHGYDLTHNDIESNEYPLVFGKRDTISSSAERSMYQTGLYLSNYSYAKLKDGTINAKEISMLNLQDTKLAVISSCSSSTGIVSTDGVYGMNRGFKMAGVKSFIGSLWEVDDNATSLLMSSFYDSLAKGADPYTSLINAQKTVKRHIEKGRKNVGSKYIYSDPYYWAGFILVDGL